LLLMFIAIVSPAPTQAAGWPLSCFRNNLKIRPERASRPQCIGISADPTPYVQGLELGEYTVNDIFYLVFSASLVFAFGQGINSGTLME